MIDLTDVRLPELGRTRRATRSGDRPMRLIKYSLARLVMRAQGRGGAPDYVWT